MAAQHEPTRLVMVIHDHQPVGNFDSVFEMAVDKSYAPFVDLLAEHPGVRLGLHLTGCLLEWLEGHRPSVLVAIKEMVGRGQVEVLGGGWAEPMLAVLPDRDAVGQIRMMRAECARLFGAVPRGMWLAERVWDPDIPRLLHAAGVEYTLLDDTHFRYAGLLDERLTGHYVTEKAGDAVAVFPIDRQLRYAIPFREPEETMAAIRSGGPGRTLTYGDDGEKFGVWPETHDWVWGKGWLKRFFELLERDESGVELLLPSEQLDRHPASGRVYLPTASYHEMGEWTLAPEPGQRLLDLKHDLADAGFAERAEPFLHGGIWLGFLAKYGESNALHKRMLRVSRKVAERSRDEGAEAILDEARRALYRGQCNCPYWHGLFGGLYLPHLRHAVYQQLVRAEAMVDGGEAVGVEVADLDGDMLDEVALEAPALVAWLDPAEGGQLLAFDDRRRGVALGHVLTRRPETYHRALLQAARKGPEGGGDGDKPKSIHDVVKSKVQDLEAKLVYDPHDRRLLVDHLLAPGASLEAIEGPGYEPLADLRRIVYAVEVAGSEAGEGRVVLVGQAPLASGGGAVHVTKALCLRAPGALEVSYALRLEAAEPLEATFAVESALALVPGPEERFAVEVLEPAEEAGRASPASRGVTGRARAVALRSSLEDATVRMTLEPDAALWRLPIETVSQSEDGAELVYQGTAVAAAWPVRLEPGGTVRRSVVLAVD